MPGLRLFRRRRRDADVAQEIRFYVDTETEENLARGMTRQQARAAALRKFGNTTSIREEAYRMNRIDLLENLWLDLRYAIRTLAKEPSFAAACVLILALGIGGNAAMFAVVRAVLLKPLVYPEPDRLVRVSLDNPQRKVLDGSFTRLRFEEVRRASRAFSGVGAFGLLTDNLPISDGGPPEALKGARVSANFLDVLGIRPALGRSFLPEEDAPGGARVVMISAALWNRRFARDRQLAGKNVRLNSLPYNVVGVLPEGFDFPYHGIDVWMPRPSEVPALPQRLWPFLTSVVGFARLKPQITLEQGQAELAVLNRQYLAAHRGRMDANPGAAFRVTPLKDSLVADVRPTLWMLFGAVGLVLLIGCANVASLLLARGALRSREFAVRTAIGAARGRLAGQLLTETLLLAGTGGALGIGLTMGALRLITRMTLFELPRAGEIRLDATALGFIVAVSIAAGIVSGMIPALQVPLANIGSLLRESGAAAGRSPGRRGLFSAGTRGLLLTAQIALTIILLIGAALLMESLARLHAVNPGFQPGNLLTAKIALPETRYDTAAKKTAFFTEVVRRAQALPDVRGAALALSLPTTVAMRTNVLVGDQPFGDVTKWPMILLQSVTPGYFRLMGIPLRQGREFTESDLRPGAPEVALVNESFARKFAPPGGILGQPLREGLDRTGGIQIVGVVGDVRQNGLSIGAEPEFYVLPTVHPSATAYLIVRTERDPMLLANSVRREVLAVDRDQPISDILPADEILEASIGQQRLTMTLLGLFAAFALILAVIGIYGMVAYSVAQRTQEVGIRRALGAQEADIVGLMLGRTIMLALTAAALGIAGALALTRILRGLLFQISANDPATYAWVALLFIVVALIAGYIPARRATRIDPADALRIG